MTVPTWDRTWRDRAWSRLGDPWDLIVVGGGITGAGILREAARRGLRALLVEAGDFASGTSSRSSKLVHGGFRYLKNAQIRLTYESVRERERLLNEARGLVNPLGFLMPFYRGDPLPPWIFGLGLAAYDLLALHWGHRFYDASDLRELCPPLCESQLRGGYRYFDAQTDDARLVLRVLQEAETDGGVALSYAYAAGLLRTRAGQVRGVRLQDRTQEGGGREQEALAPLVINATGAWAEDLLCLPGGPGLRSQPPFARRRPDSGRLLRRLRGSHLVFPARRLPISRAVSIQHPADGRFVFALPWNGVTLVGTTDVDHPAPLQTDLPITSAEVEYLLAFTQKVFPEMELGVSDVQATFSGVRPVIDTGRADPSRESREHVLWCEDGLLTITGGKLTTFRRMACDALEAAARRLGLDLGLPLHPKAGPSLTGIGVDGAGLSKPDRLRLAGRYGEQFAGLVAAAGKEELIPIPGAQALWAELRWAARAEGIVHLDDLLLRRVRLGLLLPRGGQDHLDRIRKIVQPELGWEDTRWAWEADRYANLWNRCYHFDGST